MLLPLVLGVFGAFALRNALRGGSQSGGSTARSNSVGAGSGLHRVRVRAPQAYVDALRLQGGADGQKLLMQDVADRLATMGWERPLGVVQDPTDGTLFTALARSSMRKAPTRADDVLVLEGADAVDEPSYLGDVLHRPDAREPRLDPGLTDVEVSTIRAALAVERNPSHLDGLAATFEPFHPVACSVLRAAAEHPDLARRLLTLVGNLRPDARTKGAIARARSDLEVYTSASGLPLTLLEDDVRRVACLLLDGTSDDPERAVSVDKVPPPVLALARLVVRPLAIPPSSARNEVVLVVDPAALRLALPPNGREGYVSPTAINLVVAGAKPMWAGVAHTERVLARIASLQTGTSVDDLRARSMTERAERAVERRRWLEWYRRSLGGRSE